MKKINIKKMKKINKIKLKEKFADSYKLKRNVMLNNSKINNIENKFNKNVRVSEKKISQTKQISQENINVISYLFIILFVFLLNMPSISALGITPGRTTLTFEPGLEREIQFSIINSQHKDMAVMIYTRGDVIQQGITLPVNYTEFSKDEESKTFSYRIKLPEKMEKPGKYQAEIVAMEVPKKIEGKETIIRATLAVVTQLHVYALYPGKYAEVELKIIQKDGKILFFIPVKNWGQTNISNAQATIDIKNQLGEKQRTITTDFKPIKSEERVELIAEWQPDLSPGSYKAVATLNYDGETKQIEKNFDIGEILVEVEKIIVKDFRLGEIAKFNILVNNKWSSELKDVYVEMDFYKENEEILAEIKSPIYNIPGLSKIEMTAYWDTANVKADTYDGRLYIKYEGKSIEKDIKMRVSEYEIEIIGLTGMAILPEKGKFDLQSILIVAVIVLVIINIAWFIIIRRMKKKKAYLVSLSRFLLFDFVLIILLLIEFIR